MGGVGEKSFGRFVTGHECKPAGASRSMRGAEWKRPRVVKQRLTAGHRVRVERSRVALAAATPAPAFPVQAIEIVPQEKTDPVRRQSLAVAFLFSQHFTNHADAEKSANPS